METKQVIKILLFLFIPTCLFAQTPKYSEYEVKAAFLEKFTRFIKWPDEINIDDVNMPFVMGVIGKNPFDSILKKMYSEQTIKGKKVEIRYISNLNDIDGCNLLFVSQSESDKLSKILFHTRGKPILTVSDEKKFAKRGILITLFVDSGHIRFEIDENALKKTGLYVSSLLLNLSTAVKTEEKRQ